MNTLADLRIKYPLFIYKNFSWKRAVNKLTIKFNFFIPPDIHFCPNLTIKNLDENLISHISPKVLDVLVFHLGLIELFSYWKATCSPKIIIKSGFLNSKQLKWWQKLLIRGMGQYFYENKIDFTKPNFVQWWTDSNKRFTTFQIKTQDKYLLLLGGGKDSLVSLEILRDKKKNVLPFWLNPLSNKGELLRISKTPYLIEANRKIDSTLLNLNKSGYLNGHVPFSAYLAFLSFLVSALTDCRFIVVANEKSSDEENTIFMNEKINHQYSKSWQFEKDFVSYTQKYLTADISYFSLLRPLFELQIAKLFSHYPKYWQSFNSCNHFVKLDRWCNKCPKCLTVFLLLSPFVSLEKLTAIFAKNILDDKKLLQLYLQLLGVKGQKPFECVATYDEHKVASLLLLQKLTPKKKKLPFLIDFFAKNILSKEKKIPALTRKLLKKNDKQHLIPADLAKFLKNKINEA